jgi:hypothetical protein
MTDDGKWDAVAGLRALGHRVYAEMRGTHGSRARTRFSRVAVLLVVLGFGGPILWAALRTMPTALVVVIALVVMVRVGRWVWRRYR